MTLDLMGLIGIVPTNRRRRIVRRSIDTPLHYNYMDSDIRDMDQIGHSPIPMSPRPLLTPIRRLLRLPKFIQKGATPMDRTSRLGSHTLQLRFRQRRTS